MAWASRPQGITACKKIILVVLIVLVPVVVLMALVVLDVVGLFGCCCCSSFSFFFFLFFFLRVFAVLLSERQHGRKKNCLDFAAGVKKCLSNGRKRWVYCFVVGTHLSALFCCFLFISNSVCFFFLFEEPRTEPNGSKIMFYPIWKNPSEHCMNVFNDMFFRDDLNVCMKTVGVCLCFI